MLKTGFTTIFRIVFLPVTIIGFWQEKGVPRKRIYNIDWTVLLLTLFGQIVLMTFWLLIVNYSVASFNMR